MMIKWHICPLFEDLPGLERIILFNKQKHDRHWFELWKEIRSTKWEAVVDFRGSLVSFFVRTRKRLIKSSLDKSLQKQHRLIQLSHLIHKNPPRPIPSPTLWIAPERNQLAKALLADKPTHAVGPTANWIGKQWPIERFIETLRAFCAINKDAQIAVFAAPRDKPTVKPLFEQLKSAPLLNFTNSNLSLLTLAACIRQCRLFLGNDSGLMHISASVKTPTIGLFGPSDEAVYGPWNSRDCMLDTVIRGPLSYEALILQPNFSFETRETTYMNDIAVEAVFQTLQEKWKHFAYTS